MNNPTPVNLDDSARATNAVTSTLAPGHIWPARLARAQRAMQRADVDAVLLGPGANLAYLLGGSHGSYERLTALILSHDGSLTLIVPELESALMADSIAPGVDVDVVPWKDGTDPIQLVGIALGGGARRVAVDAELPARVVLQMRDTLTNVGLLLDTALPEARIVKDAWEIQQLALAGETIDQVHRRVPSLLSPGRTESEIAQQIEELMLAAGFTGIKFISVGSGENGAIPHHAHSGRSLQNGDTVVVDLSGVIASGYHADCTRTYALEPVPAEVEVAYSALRRAFDNAMAEVRPGITASNLDAAARSTLSGHRLGDLFIHRLGHGIGLDVHEPPYIVEGNQTPLVEDMTFSIEPGLYRHGRWGMRIEDIFAVTNSGAHSFNNTSHDLCRIVTSK